MLDKFAIANVLREISALLELKEANPYKVKAYKQGAHSLELTEKDIEKLYRENKLEEIAGIGPALAAIISELYSTDTCKLLDELKSEFVDIPVELAGIEGLDLKRIQKLQQTLNINTKEELLQACQKNLLSTIPGLGKTLERKLLTALTTEGHDTKMILAKAIAFANRFMSYMQPFVLQIEPGGEIRRWSEIITQMDFVASINDLEATKKHCNKFSSFSKCEWTDDIGIGYLPNKCNVFIVLTSPDKFQNELHERTGSVAHLNKLKQIADKQGKSLYSFTISKKSNTESDIYKHLGFAYIPPELREDWGEIEEAESGETFNDLVTEKDIKGMVHCHSEFSDGNSSIETMALSAQEMGCSYITITDHSPTAFYANGLDIERLKKQWEEIDRVQEKVQIKILRGTESDILADGFLDYPDNILEKFDVVIASIHSRYKMNEDQMTQRIKTCMELPTFKIWGHALGRLLLKRDPVPCRIEEILEIVARSPVAIEINGDPHRMDLEPFWLREARRLRIKFVISTDAHSPSDLLNLPFGIHMARRAGIKKNEILNTLPYEDFKAKVKPNIN